MSNFTIKNTFVDVGDGFDESPYPPRRASSAPPTPCNSQRHGTEEEACAKMLPLKGQAPFIPMHEDEASSRSTCAPPDECDELSTSAYSAAWPSTTDASAEGAAPIERAPLSTGARMWAPVLHASALQGPGAMHMHMVVPVPMAAAPPMPSEAQVQVAEMVAAARGALRGCSCVNVVSVRVGHGGDWLVEASVDGEADVTALGKAMEAAQAELLAAAERSGGVYVIGYEAAPFAPLHNGAVGFNCSLGIVPDESIACWNLLQKGFCRRGHQCRWQHPPWQVSVRVAATTSLAA